MIDKTNNNNNGSNHYTEKVSILSKYSNYILQFINIEKIEKNFFVCDFCLKLYQEGRSLAVISNQVSFQKPEYQNTGFL